MAAEPPPAGGDADRARRAGPLAALCLSAFGLGLSPILPGTVASLATAAAAWLVPSGALALGALLFALFSFGTWATLVFADHLPAREGEKHGDPGWVVSDEVAGQAVACVPMLLWMGDGRIAAIAFVLFRIFDMTKLGPVGRAERMPGAKGVWLDDVVAGVLAAIGTLAVGWSGLLP